MNKSLDTISQYVAAILAGDSEKMSRLRSPDYIQDLVANDAFLGQPSSNQEIQTFWTHWFRGFADMDYDVTRTIGSESVVVLEWIFTGTHNGPLGHEILGRKIEPTGNTIRLRGASVFEVAGGLIEKETLYVDMATLWVELGVMS